MPALGKGPAQAAGPHAGDRPVRRQPVYHAVGVAAAPAAVLDAVIAWLHMVAHIKKERAHHPAVRHADVAAPTGDVLRNEGTGRPAGRPPLVGVAVVRHKTARLRVNFHHPLQIGGLCVSDLHGFFPPVRDCPYCTSFAPTAQDGDLRKAVSPTGKMWYNTKEISKGAR